MKRFLCGLFIIMIVVSLSACSGQSASTTTSQPKGEQNSNSNGGSSEDVIKIGVVLSVTGPASSQGKPEMDTAKLMEERINNGGGINGKKLKMVTYDDESDETKGVLAMKKLVTQDKVSIVIGGTTTGNSMAMLKVAESEKIPYISMAAGYEVTTPIKDWVFKTPQSEAMVMPQFFEYFKANNIKKVAWMHIDDAYGDSGHKFFKEWAAKNGVEIVAEEKFKATDTDMTAQLSKIKLKNPEALVTWTRPPSGAVVTKNMKQLGITIPVLHSHGDANSAFLEQTGDDANGHLVAGGKILVVDSLPDSDPQKKLIIEISKAYQEKFNTAASMFVGNSYDGVAVAVEAIKNAGTDRQKIRDYLENNIKNFVGLNGLFTFSKQDHNGLGPDSIILVKVQDKKWTSIQSK